MTEPAPTPESADRTGAETVELPLSDLQRIRHEKAEQLRDAGIEPYALRTKRTHTTAQAKARFAELEATLAGADDPETVQLAGRLVSRRHQGKTIFAHLRDGDGEVQLYLRRDDLGDEVFDGFLRLFDIGDFVQAEGHLFRTRMGEVSLRVSGIAMLAKALTAPPEKWHGLTDTEIRYRQRYADLIANAEVRDVFRLRARVITAMRRFLDELGYLEVETPALQPLYGGAAARPFTTHHNALDQTFYLRIADELYLKRLLVGGYERVYEICKDFRNEGMDRNHQPEFTMLEFYEAYADYRVMMERCEALIRAVAIAAFGEPRFTHGDHVIDLDGTWPRLTLREAIRDASGVDYVALPDADSLRDAARAAGAEIEEGTVWARIVDELLKQFVRPRLMQPAFIIDYPVALSPLAKRKADDPTHVERFQFFFGGAELGNAFTELNDPIDQYCRFRDQQRDRAAGDEEAMPIDFDYINALMYGMPPTGGVGIGVDRLVMVLADQPNLRDVILFPAMRSLGPSSQAFADDGDRSTGAAERI